MKIQSSSSHDEDVVVIDCDDISNYNPKQVLPLPLEEIGKVRTWLQATDYAHDSGEFKKHLASHMAGTSTWLTSSDTYQSWLNDETRGMLWIKGIPGSGKSVIAAHLVDDLMKSHPGTPVLYFFFRQIIDANHEPSSLLRDWLDQVLCYSPPLQKELGELIKTDRSLKSVSMEDLFRYLRLAFRDLQGKVFCVADALDEMDKGNDEFLQSLAMLGQWMPKKVKLIMTSRPVPNVEEPLRQRDVVRMRLNEKMVDTDISSYVERGLNASRLPPSDQDLIREAVPGRANGIFLYAKLAMDSFLEPGASTAAVLSTLPTDLHDMYTRLLHVHAARSSVPHDIQLLILQCVTHATRPLRLLELAEIVYVTQQIAHPDISLSLRSAKDLVRGAVGPLLEVLPNETVCVIHHSFTEYLKCVTRPESAGSYPVLRLGSTHGRLALACLMYLQAGCLDGIVVTDYDDPDKDYDASRIFERTRTSNYQRSSSIGKEEQQIRLQYPFFAYATSYWHVHVTRSWADGFVQVDINAILTAIFADKHCMKAWLKVSWAKNEDCTRGVTPSHIAARFGLTDFAHSLVAEQASVDATDVFGRTPLWWAATNGHADVVRLLVQAGANPDADDKVVGLRPLHEAASKNHAEVVRALLEAGVDPLTPKTREDPGRRCGNAPRSMGHTALMYTCRNGHLETLEAFLPFLTDLDKVHRALAWSAEYGRSKLVNRILQHPGVDVNAKVRGDTMLYMACKASDRDSIISLLEAGADPSILSSDAGDEFGGMGSRRYRYSSKIEGETRGFTALHALCNTDRRNHTRPDELSPVVLQELFAYLLTKGASVEQRTDNGSTALHSAVHSPVLTRLLLRAGADANAVDDSGRAPLHLTSSPESIGLLIEEGLADINRMTPSDGRTPLAHMLSGHHKDAVFKLLEYRPNLSMRDLEGNGPLHLAVTTSSGDITLIRFLLEAGIDANECNSIGQTPLLVMRMDDRDSFAKADLLLSHGADMNAKDHSGMTLLSRSVRSHSCVGKPDHSVIKGLLDRGADVQFRDFKGRTLLHHAVATYDSFRHGLFHEQEYTSSFDYLLTLGLDVRAVDYRGNSLIHELSLRPGMLDFYDGPPNISLWNRLLALGLDINQGNQQGRSAIHILSATDPNRHSPTKTFKVGHVGPLDFVLSKIKDIDQRDSKGLTALHLASTVSEYVTKRLLDAGANPTCTTVDGMTPLHLAARARQSNVVGMLLDSDRIKLSNAVNACDKKGNTPMYYGCRSGRPETVRLLLEAGADVSHKNLFLACAEFETEEKLWSVERHSADVEANQEAGGLTIDDSTRPGALPNKNRRLPNEFDNRKDTTRLEEIVAMLLTHGCDLAGLIGMKDDRSGRAAIEKSTHLGYEYTLGCLLHARDSVAKIPEAATSSETLFMEHEDNIQQEAQTKAATEFPHLKAGDANRSLVLTLLKNRRYSAMRPLFDKGVDFLVEEMNKPANLELFVQYGFHSLLDEIGTLKAERQLTKGKWHAYGDQSKPGLYIEIDPDAVARLGSRYRQAILLFTALNRDIPNMEVVRLLVEKFKVDVNQTRYSKTSTNDRVVPQETALHYLARGLHWWHVASAIPYLISSGADVNARDQTGRTPLHLALGGPDGYVGPFHKDAVRALIAAGADVDERDDKGRSCLGSTAADVSLVQLLIEHSAVITADALFMSINAKRLDVLDALLKAGADPNLRLEARPSVLSPGAGPRNVTQDRDVPFPEEFPLHCAATNHGVHHRSRIDKDKQTQWKEAEDLVKTLLLADADPYATFQRWTPCGMEEDNDKRGEDEAIRELLRDGRIPKVELEEVVLVHDLLDQHDLVHPILKLNTLDANRRDAKGRTLLHMACHNYDLNEPIDSLFASTGIEYQSSLPSFMDCFLARGADLLATDMMGNNVIHHMFLSNKRRTVSDKDPSTISQLCGLCPSLIGQGNVHGKRPLHLALKHAALHGDIAPAETLLAMGADPLVVDNNGNGPLHILAFAMYRSAGVRSLFAKLLHRGLDINAKSNRGETPIFNLNKHLPASAGMDDFISASEALLLFETAGADLFAKDNQGKGLLHIAAKEMAEPVQDDYVSRVFPNRKPTEPSIARFQALLSRGLDPRMEDAQKRTALDVAAACGKESVLKLFEKEDAAVRLPVGMRVENSDDGDDW